MTTSTEKIWRPFRLLDYFDFIKGDQNDMSALEAGDLPLVSAKNSNNGYKAFVADNGKKIFSGHCLTLNTDGDGGAGIAYYQPTKFLLDTHVTALYPKIEMSREMLLFISRSITIQRGKFGHGYSLNNKRLKIFQVMLPVNDDGSPDFVFMENYVRAVEEKLLQRYRDFAQEKLSALETKKIPPLNEKIWRTFNLAEVFSIRATSSGIDKNKIISGEKIFPYISRTDRNNGVQDFICEQPNYKRDEGNCITVGLDTQTAFYQPTTFYTGQNIQILRNDNLNFYVAQFVLPLLKKTLSIFSWGGNGATLTRLRRSKIQLPVNDDGAPDFEYMEAYAKNLEAEKYRKYLAYIGDD